MNSERRRNRGVLDYLGEGQMDDGEWERERMKDINKTSPVRRVWRD